MMSVPGIILTLVLVVHAAIHPEEFGLQETEGQILGHVLDCNMLDECEDIPGKICASNGETYTSLCTYMRAYCDEKEIVFEHHEECTASEKCLGQRKFALKKAATQSGYFIPTCKKDGTFAPVQCHKDNNYCWCSTPAGLGIPGSSVLDRTPICDNHTGPSSSGHSTKGSSSSQAKGTTEVSFIYPTAVSFRPPIPEVTTPVVIKAINTAKRKKRPRALLKLHPTYYVWHFESFYYVWHFDFPFQISNCNSLFSF